MVMNYIIFTLLFFFLFSSVGHGASASCTPLQHLLPVIHMSLHVKVMSLISTEFPLTPVTCYRRDVTEAPADFMLCNTTITKINMSNAKVSDNVCVPMFNNI